MNGRSHQKQTHYVPRPLTEDMLTARPSLRGAAICNLYSECDSAQLSEFVRGVVLLGFAVSFSVTSDGGALSISIYDGFTRFKGYVRHAYQFEDRFDSLLRRARGEE